jgi:hypothetical protein
LRLIFKIVFTLLLIGVGFSFTDRYFMKDHFYNKTIKTFEESNDIEIAIFGSSHAHTAYDPRLIESEIEISTMNFGALDQKLETTSLVVNYVLEKSKLQLAIIDVFPGNVAGIDNDRAKAFQLETLDHMPCSIDKIQLMFSTYDYNDMPMSFSTTLRNHSKWYELKDLNWKKRTYIWPGIDYFKGFRSYKDTISEKQWNDFVSSKKSQWVPKSLEESKTQRIDRLIELFNDKGIPVLFVNAPSFMYDYSERYSSDSKKIKEYIESKKIDFIDFNELKDSLGLSKRHFIDSGHLNAKGALVVSEYLANYLKEHFTFDLRNKLVNIENNRYRHISENYRNSIYHKTIEDESREKFPGILNFAFYMVSDGTYEILMETKTSHTEELPYRLSYKYSDIVDGKEEMLYNDKVNHRNIYVYKNRNFIVIPVDFPNEEIEELTFTLGNNYENEFFKTRTFKIP